jgi:hypothetical protein
LDSGQFFCQECTESGSQRSGDIACTKPIAKENPKRVIIETSMQKLLQFDFSNTQVQPIRMNEENQTHQRNTQASDRITVVFKNGVIKLNRSQ